MSFKNRCHCDTWYGRCKNNYLVSLNPLYPGPPHKFVGQLEHFLSQSDWSVPDKKYHFLRKIFGLGFFDRQKKHYFHILFLVKIVFFTLCTSIGGLTTKADIFSGAPLKGT